MWSIKEVKSGLYLGHGDISEPSDSTPIVAVKAECLWDITPDHSDNITGIFNFYQ